MEYMEYIDQAVIGLIVLLLLLLFLLIIRSIIVWYLKINERKELLEKQNKLLEEIRDKMK